MESSISRLLFLLPIVLVATGCVSNGNQNVSGLPTSVEVATPAAKEPATNVLSSDDLAYFRRFAESYEPRSGREVIPSPPVPDERLTRILAKAAGTRTREHEKFVILIILRLSRFQLEHFKQGFELGRTNPLTVEFYRLIGKANPKDYLEPEIMEPYLANIYVREHPELREYGPIDREMRRYDAIAKRIKTVDL